MTHSDLTYLIRPLAYGEAFFIVGFGMVVAYGFIRTIGASMPVYRGEMLALITLVLSEVGMAMYVGARTIQRAVHEEPLSWESYAALALCGIGLFGLIAIAWSAGKHGPPWEREAERAKQLGEGLDEWIANGTDGTNGSTE